MYFESDRKLSRPGDGKDMEWGVLAQAADQHPGRGLNEATPFERGCSVGEFDGTTRQQIGSAER